MTCPVFRDYYKCALGASVTFYRNTDAHIWVFFNPLVSTVGILDHVVVFQANNFQNSTWTHDNSSIFVLSWINPEASAPVRLLSRSNSGKSEVRRLA